MIEIPPVNDVSVASLPLRLVDIRSAPEQDVWKAKDLFVKLLFADFLLEERPGVEMCSFMTGEEVNGCDPNLSMLDFVVYDTLRLEVCGAFNIYNIKPEKETRSGATVSAMAAPAIRASGRLTVAETWSAVMRHLLSTDIFAPGFTLDIIQWDFSERREHAWKGTERADQIITSMRALDYDVSDKDGYPTKVRRREVKDGRLLR